MPVEQIKNPATLRLCLHGLTGMQYLNKWSILGVRLSSYGYMRNVGRVWAKRLSGRI